MSYNMSYYQGTYNKYSAFCTSKETRNKVMKHLCILHVFSLLLIVLNEKREKYLGAQHKYSSTDRAEDHLKVNDTMWFVIIFII